MNQNISVLLGMFVQRFFLMSNYIEKLSMPNDSNTLKITHCTKQTYYLFFCLRRLLFSLPRIEILMVRYFQSYTGLRAMNSEQLTALHTPSHIIMKLREITFIWRKDI